MRVIVNIIAGVLAISFPDHLQSLRNRVQSSVACGPYVALASLLILGLGNLRHQSGPGIKVQLFKRRAFAVLACVPSITDTFRLQPFERQPTVGLAFHARLTKANDLGVIVAVEAEIAEWLHADAADLSMGTTYNFSRSLWIAFQIFCSHFKSEPGGAPLMLNVRTFACGFSGEPAFLLSLFISCEALFAREREKLLV